jgi:hypothetical protein
MILFGTLLAESSTACQCHDSVALIALVAMGIGFPLGGIAALMVLFMQWLLK